MDCECNYYCIHLRKGQRKSICISQHCFFFFVFFSRKHNPPVAKFQTQQEVGKLIVAQASA